MSELTHEALLAFARKVIDCAIEGNDADGGDVQQWAVEAGLLIPTMMQAPCDQNYCICEESGDFPQECYRYCEALLRAPPQGGTR